MIAILRNPIDRAFSHALWGRSYRPEEIARLDEVILSSQKFLTPGLYYTHLKNYFDAFDRRQIKLFLYEELQADSQKVVIEIFDFLGVDSQFAPKTDHQYHAGRLKVVNRYQTVLKYGQRVSPLVRALLPPRGRAFLRRFLQSKSRAPKPQMSPYLRAQLTDYFREEMMQLQVLINCDLSHWLALQVEPLQR